VNALSPVRKRGRSRHRRANGGSAGRNGRNSSYFTPKRELSRFPYPELPETSGDGAFCRGPPTWHLSGENRSKGGTGNQGPSESPGVPSKWKPGKKNFQSRKTPSRESRVSLENWTGIAQRVVGKKKGGTRAACYPVRGTKQAQALGDQRRGRMV